jgi:WD40-like Beta Propeller Repeat
MCTLIRFAMVVLMSTLVSETSAAAQTISTPQAITDPKEISSKPNAQVEPKSLTIEKLYMTRQVGRATWSPDGKSIAFISNMSAETIFGSCLPRADGQCNLR